MPAKIKTAICVLVALVAAGTWYVEQSIGNTSAAWVAVLLALFMIVAMWIFPEAQRREDE